MLSLRFCKLPGWLPAPYSPASDRKPAEAALTSLAWCPVLHSTTWTTLQISKLRTREGQRSGSEQMVCGGALGLPQPRRWGAVPKYHGSAGSSKGSTSLESLHHCLGPWPLATLATDQAPTNIPGLY